MNESEYLTCRGSRERSEEAEEMGGEDREYIKVAQELWRWSRRRGRRKATRTEEKKEREREEKKW